MRDAFAVPVRIGLQVALNRSEKGTLFIAAGMRNNRTIAFSLGTQVQQQCRITAIVENHVGKAAVVPLEDAVGVFPIVLNGFSLDRKDRDAFGRHGSRSVILGGKNIAACPTDLRTQGDQRFNEDSRLDGHVQRTGDAGSF